MDRGPAPKPRLAGYAEMAHAPARKAAALGGEEVLKQGLVAWTGQWEAPVRIGWRPGFREQVRKEFEAEVTELLDGGQVHVDHPRSMLRDLAAEIRGGRCDGWFDDPAR